MYSACRGGPSRLNGQTGRRVGDASGLLLLNCFLSPAVVKHLKVRMTRPFSHVHCLDGCGPRRPAVRG